jgi:N-dimethylarginine dimethylaminohydrolase
VPEFKQKILMCAPDFFGVDYVINPWMESNRGKTDRDLVHKQWNGLCDALAAHAEIVLMTPQPEVPDLVFTANAGMVLGNLAIASRFRSLERQKEEPYNRTWFRENGFDLAPWPKNVYFEGAGDILIDRGKEKFIWAGSGFRSAETALGLLRRLFDRRVVDLRLVDPRFYHLDTCFCPLEGGYLMYYPPALAPESREEIEDNVPLDKRILVSQEDALTFACNAVDLEGHIFMNAATPGLKDKLKKAGFETVVTPLTEFLKAGGTAKCLTLKLREN